jgi:hypothetical protein
VDNTLIFDDWTSHGPKTYTASLPLAAGNHSIKLEYYENTGGATVKLGWAKAGTTTRTEVVVDDRASGFSKGGSYWRESTTGYNSHSWWTYVYGNRVDSWAEWKASLQGGSYEVFVYVPAANNTSQSAKYTVYYHAGSAVKTVSQSASGGRWVSLGTYTFDASSSPARRVRLTDATGEATNSKRLAFDAVRFTPR